MTLQPITDDPNGFVALGVYDTLDYGGNANGIIDAGDSVFSYLRLWQDANHNAFSEPAELKTLSSLGFTAIGLAYQTSQLTDQYGNEFRYVSVTQINGKILKLHDVFLLVDTDNAP